MATRKTLTVSITPEQDALVRACVRSGRYASASEVLRAALRQFQEDETPALAAAGKTPATGTDRG